MSSADHGQTALIYRLTMVCIGQKGKEYFRQQAKLLFCRIKWYSRVQCYLLPNLNLVHSRITERFIHVIVQMIAELELNDVHLTEDGGIVHVLVYPM